MRIFKVPSEDPKVFFFLMISVQGGPFAVFAQGFFLWGLLLLSICSAPSGHWLLSWLATFEPGKSFSRQLWSGYSPSLADRVTFVGFLDFTPWKGLTAFTEKSKRSQPLFLVLWLIIFRWHPVQPWIIYSFPWLDWRVSNSAQWCWVHLCKSLQLHPLCLLQILFILMYNFSVCDWLQKG